MAASWVASSGHCGMGVVGRSLGMIGLIVFGQRLLRHLFLCSISAGGGAVGSQQQCSSNSLGRFPLQSSHHVGGCCGMVSAWQGGRGRCIHTEIGE